MESVWRRRVHRLEMTRSSDDLEITFAANTGSGVFTIFSQYETGNRSAIERDSLRQPMSVGAGT